MLLPAHRPQQPTRVCAAGCHQGLPGHADGGPGVRYWSDHPGQRSSDHVDPGPDDLLGRRTWCRADGRIPLPAQRHRRKVGTVPLPRLAARCHGGPHTRLGPYPRRDDGRCRHLRSGAAVPDLRPVRPGAPGARRDHGDNDDRFSDPCLRSVRHQASAGLLHHQPDRDHALCPRHCAGVHRRRPRSVVPVVARDVQGLCSSLRSGGSACWSPAPRP